MKMNPPPVASLAQLLSEQPTDPPPGWIEPGLLPPQGILFLGGEPKIGKSLLVANLALALAAGTDRVGFPARLGLPIRTAGPPFGFPASSHAPRAGIGGG
jgi:hypothetical protein